MAADVLEPEAFTLLDDLNRAFDKLAATDLTSLSGDQLLAFTSDWERHKRRGSTLDHATVAELDSRHTAGEKGHRSSAALIGELLRIDPGQARRRVRDAGDFATRHGLSGEPLPPLRPDTARALSDGDIGIEHARAVSDLFEHLPAQTRDANRLSRPPPWPPPQCARRTGCGNGACKPPPGWTRTGANPSKPNSANAA